MALLRNVSDGLRNLFQRKRAERELDEELQDFVESSVADKVRSGMSREQAYREARIELGGAEAVKESVRTGQNRQFPAVRVEADRCGHVCAGTGGACSYSSGCGVVAGATSGGH